MPATSKLEKTPSMTREQRKQARLASRTAVVTRQAGMAFLEADADGNGELDFEEFQACFARLREVGNSNYCGTGDSLRTLFDEIDANKSGTIAMDEYFLWALSVAGKSGGGLEAVFNKYDKGGEGRLDMIEFALAVEDLGFSAAFAQDIFLELDDDNSGTITYSELLQALRNQVGTLSDSTKRFLASLAFQGVPRSSDEGAGMDDKKHADPTAVDTSLWQLYGPDEESLRKQIQAELIRSSLRDSDLYRLMVASSYGDGEETLMTRVLFVDGMHRLGYKGSPVVLNDIYRVLDAEKADVIGPHELHQWITGKMARLTKARSIHLLHSRTDGVTLHSMDWRPNEIRREIVSMLMRAGLAPLDLIRAWDLSRDGTFSSREFMIMMKKVVRPPSEVDDPIWYTIIRPAIESLFHQIAGRDKTINCIEFVRWLNEEWRIQKVADRESRNVSTAAINTAQIKASNGDCTHDSSSGPAGSKFISLDDLFLHGRPHPDAESGPPSCPKRSISPQRWSSRTLVSGGAQPRPRSSPSGRPSFPHTVRLDNLSHRQFRPSPSKHPSSATCASLTSPGMPSRRPMSASAVSTFAVRESTLWQVTGANSSQQSITKQRPNTHPLVREQPSPRSLRIRSCVARLADELGQMSIVKRHFRAN